MNNYRRFLELKRRVAPTVKLGQRAWACELKESYWRTAVDNLTRLEAELDADALFDVRGLAS